MSRRARQRFIDNPLAMFPKNQPLRLSKAEYTIMKAKVHERDGHRCINPDCMSDMMGYPYNELTIHHDAKRSQGGDDKPENCATLCLLCHDLVELKKISDKFVKNYLRALYPNKRQGE